MNNQHSVHYPSSSDSDTDSVSILSVDDTGEVSYQTDTAYFEEELVFKMENLIEPTTDSVKPPTSNIDHEPPTFSVSSHYPKASNATVMMRSSLFQNKLEDPSMMLSRSLGVYEMGEPFLSSQQALFGTSLPNDLSSITPDWDVNDDKIVVDDEPVEKVPSKAKHKSAEAKIEWPTLEVTQPFDEGTCLNEDLDSLLDNGPLLVDDMKTFHEENDEDPSLTQNSVLGTNVILIGEVPIIGNTYTQDALFAKGVIPEPIGEAENDALAMSTHASNTTINDSTLDEHMIPGILAPNFESNQEWFNVSQNCFFKENTEKPPKRTNRNKPKKQVSFKVYRKATVLKVVGLNTNSIFKDLQRYFYDPSILNIRYLRPLHTAYITYRNYLSMMNAILKFDGLYLNGMMISCIQSTTKEMAYEADVSKSYKPENYSDPAMQGYANLKNDITMPYVYQYTHIQVPPCYERYFIIKPKLMSEVIFSSRHNYWYVSKRHSDYLDRLFENTESVYFIYSVTGSKSLQGYARMKSNIINIRSATMNELEGTPFSTKGDLRFGATGKVWQYVFRVEWMMHGYISLNSLAHLKNSWSNNAPVKTSTDFTQLDPEVGRFILDKFHI